MITELRTAERASTVSHYELRTAVYSGTLFLMPASTDSLALANATRDIIMERLGQNYRHAQFKLSEREFLGAISTLKKSVYESEHIRALTLKVTTSCGFRLEDNWYDPPRLRGVAHEAHLQTGSAPAFRPHRDTWYGNPQAQLNWWMPLHDVTEENSFSFFHKYFHRGVPNSSAGFDYDVWSKTVGFGNSQSGNGALYPSPLVEITDDAPSAFRAEVGQILIFSASHLHCTNMNNTGSTRFSLDFRTVNLEDHAAGRGAPNIDNESSGSSLADYRPCASLPIREQPGSALT